MNYFSTAQKQDLLDIVIDEYPDREGEIAVYKGIDLLVKLINCRVEGQINSGSEISEFLTVWKERDLLRFEVVEKVMKKIVALHAQEKVEMKPVAAGCNDPFAGYYCKFGIMSSLDGHYLGIKGASRNFKIKDDKKHIYEQLKIYNPTSDKEKWKACNCSHAYMYLWAWRYSVLAKDPNAWLKNEEKLLAQKCFYTVLLDLCLRYSDLIERCYKGALEESVKKDIIESKADLRKKNNKMKEFVENIFTELEWGLDEEDGIVWDQKHRAIMLIGEAGAGKTTQMEKLYWDELCSVDATCLPIWIKIQDIKENELLEVIQDSLAGLGGRFEELMEYGMISLYLDGLNELLTDDRDAGISNLVRVISFLVNKYEKLRICMTDRTSEKVMHLVEENKVDVYKCKSMDEERAREYCTKYYGSDEAEKIIEAVAVTSNKKENVWFWNDNQHAVTPQKVNALAEMVVNGNPPGSETAYYTYFIQSLLERELKDKKDVKVSDLEKSLHKLAVMMEYNINAQYVVDIFDVFAEVLGNDYEKIEKYFELACQLPLLVEQLNKRGTYLFQYYGYFSYFRDYKDEAETKDLP